MLNAGRIYNTRDQWNNISIECGVWLGGATGAVLTVEMLEFVSSSEL